MNNKTIAGLLKRLLNIFFPFENLIKATKGDPITSKTLKLQYILSICFKNALQRKFLYLQQGE